MNIKEGKQSGERLSFFKLFNEKKYRIVIPIIQRDYAQGRATTADVRNTFLDALFTYLDENKPNRDLDFIYGSLKENVETINFIPLDGQQRLTTLFLLHWYLYQISDDEVKKQEFKSVIQDDSKSMFTYETRPSSSEFCNALVCNNIDFNKLLPPDRDVNGNEKGNGLSKTIMNCAWFYLSWKSDPTIQSMLTMLDAIHKRFAGHKEFFNRLIDKENPVITFLFLNLEDFNLTDDLYIKMNSRGKLLSSFENFKAKMEQYLEEVNPARSFLLNFEGIEKKVSLKDYFSHNIDTKWADLFWNYRKLKSHSINKDDNDFDDGLMNFIRIIFTYQYAIRTDVTLKDKDDSLEYLLGTNVARKMENYSDDFSFYTFRDLNAISEDSILYLIDAFDCLSNGNKKAKVRLSENYQSYFDENKTFENVLRHNFESNQERICFHAYLRYLIKYKSDIGGLNQWMRVVHNLTHPENTIIDNASEMASAIKSVEELLPYGNNILEYLKQNPKISLFSSWQTQEEKAKAHLITKDDQWRHTIEDLEKHRYFNGQIGFVLEFAGILEYYDQNADCNWEDELNAQFFDTFSKYAQIAANIFEESYENRINDSDYVFERAVLTKGDYLTSLSYNRKNLLSTGVVKNNIKRDHSWKRLLRISDDQLKHKRQFVKQVFDDTRLEINNIEKSLDSICQDRTQTWRDYFIECPSLIAYCNQGIIKFEDEKNIMLYGQSQSNHFHVEMYTYYLWKTYFEARKNFFYPFKDIYYTEVKSIDYYPCIRFNGFCHDKVYYKIEIYYCNTDNLPHSYEIAFFKEAETTNIPEKYDDDIKYLLSKNDFTWSDESKAYFFTCDNQDQLIDKMEQFTQKLKELGVI